MRKIEYFICMFCAGVDKGNYRKSVAFRTRKYTGVGILVAQRCVRTSARTGTFRTCTRVGLGPTPGKSSSYSFEQGSISSAPTSREIEMAAEVERLRNLCEEQNTKYATKQQELESVKRMVAMIMAGKVPSTENNQEGDA